jgi:hypothetical protein
LFRQVDAGHVMAADLEEQRLLDLQAAVGREGRRRRVAIGGHRRGRTSLFVQH